MKRKVIVCGVILALLLLTVWAAAAIGSMPSAAERREEALKSLLAERTDIAAEDITEVGTNLGTYIRFCTEAAAPQPVAGWAVEPLEPGCFEVMPVETAQRLAEMREEQREYTALAPVRYILGDSDATLAKAEGQSGVYVAVLPAYEANRLMRDPEFAMRAQDAGLTPVLIDRVEEVIVDTNRYVFDQPMLGIEFDLSDAEAGE